MATIAAAEEARPSFTVWTENEAALRLFLATQWRVGFGGRTGLDYQSVVALMALRKTKKREAMFEALQAMEHAALDEFNRQRPSS